MQEIYDKLAPVRSRQKARCVIRSASRGLLVTAVVSAALAAVSSVVQVPYLRLVAWAVLVAGPLIGGAIAFFSRNPWSAAAQAVDRHFDLDARAQSAVTFLESGKVSGMYALQVRDTSEHLAKLDTPSAVPFRVSKADGASILCALAAAALIAFLPEGGSLNIANRNEVAPTDRPDEKPAKPLAKLPADVSWQPAANGKVLRPPDDSMSVVEPGVIDETSVRIKVDEQHIDRAYAPTFNATP